MARAVPAFLFRLLQTGGLLRGTRLQPEELLCIAFANRLRELTLLGACRIVWFHVPNEGRRSKHVAQILRQMGLVSGTPDFVFMGGNTSAALEFKAKGGQTARQRDFQSWCEAAGIPYRVVRTPQEGETALREWGLLEGC